MSLEVKKKLFFHLGFPRTGTTLLQTYLFPKHSQINDISNLIDGKVDFLMNPDLKESIWRMNDKEFNNSYEEKLNKLKNIYLSLDSNKCNILSTEHYLLPKVFSYRECTFDVFKWLLRLISLFNKTNIDLNFFLVIRNHSDIIPSFYFQTSINRFLKEFSISAKDIIKYFQTRKNNNMEISKKLFDNFKYGRFYNYLSSHLKQDKIKFFLYEDLQYNKETFFPMLSNYLGIEISETRKLLYNRKINVTADKIKYQKIYYLIYKNLKQPKNLFINFFRKLYSFVKFLYLGGKYVEYKKIKQHSQLIKKYYREDCLELEKKLQLGLDRFNYF